MDFEFSLIQIEIVACAPWKANGKKLDDDVLIGDHHGVRVNSWQAYEDEARKSIVASRTLEIWSKTLTSSVAWRPATIRSRRPERSHHGTLQTAGT